MDLHGLYKWCEAEWGAPVVMHPYGYGLAEQADITANGESAECYWAVLENKGRRYIALLIDGTKSISESAGPLMFNCPLYFFELVPLEVNTEWRAEVRAFWEEHARGGD